MKKGILTSTIITVGMLTACTQSYETATISSGVDSASYSIGILIGSDLEEGGNQEELNINLIAAGLHDALRNKENIVIEKEEAVQVWQGYRKKAWEKEAEKNKMMGEAFLEENKEKEGVVTLPSGLQYKVEVEGSGPVPTHADEVRVHYTGMLLDGTVFDSSVDRGEPFDFPVTGRIIKGWSEALQLMPTGSKWKLFIPSDLAYGERGAGKKIGPNSVLIFDVELLEILPK